MCDVGRECREFAVRHETLGRRSQLYDRGLAVVQMQGPRCSCPGVVAIHFLRMAADDDLYVGLDMKIVIGQITVVARYHDACGFGCVRMGETQSLDGFQGQNMTLTPGGFASPCHRHAIHAGQPRCPGPFSNDSR